MIKSDFYTPTSLWEGFDDGLPLKEVVLNKIKIENALMSEVYFSGRAVGTERVRVYGFYSVPVDGCKGALLYLPNEDEPIGFDSLKDYVDEGYCVLTVDLYGERDSLKNHTEYPSNISYANLATAGRRKDYVDESAKETCWYEWVSVARYAVSFLNDKGFSKIGVVGNKTGANVGWQLVAFDERVTCFIAMFGAGWTAYKDVYKYADDVGEIESDQSFRKYVAAVDAHAYAQYAKCPILYLTSTNSNFFEFDRAGDTMSRVDGSVACRYNYAIGYGAHLDSKCKTDSFLFLEAYASDIKRGLPQNPELTVENIGDKLRFTVRTEASFDVTKITLAVNEGVVECPYRNWDTYTGFEKHGEAYTYEYTVKGDAEMLFAFCSVEYDSGLTLSTKEVFSRLEKKNSMTSRLIYSSKFGLNGLCFLDREEPDKVFCNRTLDLKFGAGGISGAYSPDGIISYAFIEKKYFLNDNSLLKFDVFAEEYCSLRLSLIKLSIDGEIEEFNCVEDIKAESVWQNLIVKITDFKSENGMGVKNYDGVIALGIKSEAKFVVNNVLVI